MVTTSLSGNKSPKRPGACDTNTEKKAILILLTPAIIQLMLSYVLIVYSKYLFLKFRKIFSTILCCKLCIRLFEKVHQTFYFPLLPVCSFNYYLNLMMKGEKKIFDMLIPIKSLFFDTLLILQLKIFELPISVCLFLKNLCFQYFVLIIF